MNALAVSLAIFSLLLWAMFNFSFTSTLNSVMLVEKPEVFSLIISFSVITNLSAVLFFISFFRASTTSPGRIPDCPPWNLVGPGEDIHANESKRSGGRRFCRYERKYKPDRCHHCSQCNQCTLRMDHHCPWLDNCVGFWNYKFFILTLLYGCLTLLLITATTGWLGYFLVHQTSLLGIDVSRLATGTILSAICGLLSLVLVLFFSIHVVMVVKGVTTLEVFEKSRDFSEDDSCLATVCCTKKDPITKEPLHPDSVYRHKSTLSNIKAAIGDDVLNWLIPTMPRMKTGSPDGLVYARALDNGLKAVEEGDDSPLINSLE